MSQKSTLKATLIICILLLASVTSLVQQTVAMPSGVGVTTVNTALNFPTKRVSFYSTTAFRFFQYFVNNSYLVYCSSTDGETWSSQTSIGSCTQGGYFAIGFSGTYVDYALKAGAYLYYRRGIPQSDGTISYLTTQKTVFSTMSGTNYVAMCIDSSNYPWIEYVNSSLPYVVMSNTTDGTWTTDTGDGFPYKLSVTSGTWYVGIVPLNSGSVLSWYGRSGYVWSVQSWTGSAWQAEKSSAYSPQSGKYVSMVNVSADAYICYLRNTDNKIYSQKYTYSTNTVETAEVVTSSAVTSTSTPSLGVDTATNDLYCFFMGSPTANHVYYAVRNYSTSTWQSPVDWLTESSLTANDDIVCFLQSYGGQLGASWLTGAGSPYSVRFGFLSFSALANAVTILSSPRGSFIYVDSVLISTPKVYSWNIGTTHNLTATTAGANLGFTSYTFSNWSDGGSRSHTITVSVSTSLYTANYQVSVNSSSYFSLIQISDTQYLVYKFGTQWANGYFTQLMNWIVSKYSIFNAKMVIHTGDVVETGESVIEQSRANSSLGILLDHDIPYSWNAGNHDQYPINDPNTISWMDNATADGYKAVDVSVLISKTYWVGSKYGGNTAVKFSFGSQNFLVINLEYRANSTVLDWAESIIEDPIYTNYNVILCSHVIINYDTKENDAWSPTIIAFMSPYPNIPLTLNGHVFSGTTLTSNYTRNGNREETVFNFQGGGDPTSYKADSVRLLTFDLQGNKCYSNIYCVYNDTWLTAPYYQYNFSLNFWTQGYPINITSSGKTLTVGGTDWSIKPSTSISLGMTSLNTSLGMITFTSNASVSTLYNWSWSNEALPLIRSLNGPLTWFSTGGYAPFSESLTVELTESGTSTLLIDCGSLGEPTSTSGEGFTYTYSDVTGILTVAIAYAGPIPVKFYWTEIEPVTFVVFQPDLALMQIYFTSGNLVGFIIAIFTSVLGQMGYAIIVFVIWYPIYMRTNSLTYTSLLWLLCGSLFMPLMPLTVFHIGYVLIVLGIAAGLVRLILG